MTIGGKRSKLVPLCGRGIDGQLRAVSHSIEIICTCGGNRTFALLRQRNDKVSCLLGKGRFDLSSSFNNYLSGSKDVLTISRKSCQFITLSWRSIDRQLCAVSHSSEIICTCSGNRTLAILSEGDSKVFLREGCLNLDSLLDNHLLGIEDICAVGSKRSQFVARSWGSDNRQLCAVSHSIKIICTCSGNRTFAFLSEGDSRERVVCSRVVVPSVAIRAACKLSLPTLSFSSSYMLSETNVSLTTPVIKHFKESHTLSL